MDDLISIQCTLKVQSGSEIVVAILRDDFAQLVTINGKIYVGLQRKSYYEDKNNPRLEIILLPIAEWTTLVQSSSTRSESSRTDDREGDQGKTSEVAGANGDTQVEEATVF